MEKPPSLEWLQNAVGGFIEQVPYFTSMKNGERAVAFCNEYGKLKRMQINEAATQAWAAALERTTDDAGPLNDILVGPVVVLTGDSDFMERHINGDEDGNWP